MRGLKVGRIIITVQRFDGIFMLHYTFVSARSIDRLDHAGICVTHYVRNLS